MTTTTATIATAADVPAADRDLYALCRRSEEVRLARAAYWTHDPDPTPEGTEAVMHRAAMALMERRRESHQKSQAWIAALDQMAACSVCGATLGVGLTRRGLCRACSEVDDWLKVQRLAAEDIDGNTRGDRVAAWRKEHPA